MALRQAIDTHPNRPTIDLRTFGRAQTDEDNLDSKQTEQEVLPASSLRHTTTVSTSTQVIDGDNEDKSPTTTTTTILPPT